MVGGGGGDRHPDFAPVTFVGSGQYGGAKSVCQSPSLCEETGS